MPTKVVAPPKEAKGSRAGKSPTPTSRFSLRPLVDRIVARRIDSEVLSYSGSRGIEEFVLRVLQAPPMQLLETERRGVSARFLTDMAKWMNVPFTHLAESIGIPKATAVRKQAKNDLIDGASAIALARLLAIANEMVEDSTASRAQMFDAAQWFGKWIEHPQPALGGRKPSELLDTPTGVAMVTKVLGAIRSGAYQ